MRLGKILMCSVLGIAAALTFTALSGCSRQRHRHDYYERARYDRGEAEFRYGYSRGDRRVYDDRYPHYGDRYEDCR